MATSEQPHMYYCPLCGDKHLTIYGFDNCKVKHAHVPQAHPPQAPAEEAG